MSLRAVVRAQLEAVTRRANGAEFAAQSPFKECARLVDMIKLFAGIDQTKERSLRQFVCNSFDVFVN